MAVERGYVDIAEHFRKTGVSGVSVRDSTKVYYWYVHGWPENEARSNSSQQYYLAIFTFHAIVLEFLIFY